MGVNSRVDIIMGRSFNEMEKKANILGWNLELSEFLE